MPDLFTPLTIGGRELPNRIVLAPAPCGLAPTDGFVTDEVIHWYARRAEGGVGLLVSEGLRVTPPADEWSPPHLGIYADPFVLGLRRLVAASRARGARIILSLEEPAPPEAPPVAALRAVAEAFALAAWRAYCAGADGVMLSAADGGLLHRLISPLSNQRHDAYGLGADGRQRLALEIIEGVRLWLGGRLLVGFRMLADEFAPGGMTLQDARVLAKRVTAAGVRLLDVTAPAGSANIARFPGWAVPLANSIKRITDVPVIGSGQLGDPHLADSVVRDGSVDLVMLGRALRADPDWPRAARAALEHRQPGA